MEKYYSILGLYIGLRIISPYSLLTTSRSGVCRSLHIYTYICVSLFYTSLQFSTCVFRVSFLGS